MKVLSIRIDEETHDALKFLIDQESAYRLRKVSTSEYLRYLITKESLHFAFKKQQKDS